MTPVSDDLRGEFSGEGGRDRDWRPGDLGLQFLSRVLDLGVDDAAHEIDIFGTEPARLG
jgi:hypothetical protein